MNLLRALYETTSAILNRYLYSSTTKKWQNDILKLSLTNRDPHRTNDGKGYLRIHNSTTQNPHYSIIEKWRNNVFKSPQQLDSDADFNDGFDGEQLDVVGAVGSMPKCALIQYDEKIPSKCYISYQDYVVVCDTSMKAPFYAIQGVTKRTAECLAHRHCEAFKIVLRDKPEDYHFGMQGYSERLLVKHVQPAGVERGEVLCDYCRNLNFWKVFNGYIKFLTQFYDMVYLCSGSLFLQQGDGDIDRGTEDAPSHFFKVIFCKNGMGSYRFECYIVENKQLQDQHPDLWDFLVSREELQRISGMNFFPKIANRMIKQNTPSRFYAPKRNSTPTN